MDDYLLKQYYEFIEQWEFGDPGLAKERHMLRQMATKNTDFLFERKGLGTTVVTDRANVS